MKVFLDYWAIMRDSLHRWYCRLFHWHMFKLWEVTTSYRIRFCRICGQEHASRIERRALAIWPLSVAARWYRHHTGGEQT
jgi:hypothetical protein